MYYIDFLQEQPLFEEEEAVCDWVDASDKIGKS